VALILDMYRLSSKILECKLYFDLVYRYFSEVFMKYRVFGIKVRKL